MKGLIKRLCTGFLALATIATTLPTTVHASEKQYWTESTERVGIIEKVMNDGSISSTFNEGYMRVEGETAYCIDINTDFKNGYKTRADASTRMSADQIADVALSLEYVKQYGASHKELNYKQVYLLEQCVVWQRLSVHLGWQCDNVRASYDEIPKAIQDEVYSGAKAFVKANKGRYDCGGYIYSGQGQELGQFWAKLAVGNATLKKTSDNSSITDGNGIYSIAGATYGVYADKECNNQLATLTTDESGNTETVEVRAGTLYIKELSAPAGYKVDKNVYSLKVEAGKTATLNVSDTPKATDTLIELFENADTLSKDEATEILSQISENTGLNNWTISGYYDYVNAQISFSNYLIYGIIALILFLASALVIYSIFYISVGQKVAEYGQLRTIGASKKQIYKIVLKEGYMLAIPGIIIGCIIGSIISYCLQSKGWSFLASILSLLGACIFGLLLVYISVHKPAKIASNVSPISALKNQVEIVNYRKHKSHNITPLYLAKISLSRNRKKSLLTILSMSLCGIIFFLSASYQSSFNAESMARSWDMRYGDFKISVDLENDSEDLDSILRKEYFSDYVTQVKNMEGVQEVFTYSALPTEFSVDGKNTDTTLLLGYNEKDMETLNKAVLSGKITDETELVVSDPDRIYDVYHWKPQVGDTVSFSFQNYNGETITKELKIGAITSSKDGMGGYLFRISEEALKKFAGYDCTYAIEIQEKPESYQTIEQQLRHLIVENKDVQLLTLEEIIAKHQSDNSAGFTLAYTIAIILWIFATINQINLTITNLLAQKKEMGILKSIGMTDKQLKKSFIFEGLFIIMVAIFITCIIGIPGGYIIGTSLKNAGMSTGFVFPLVSFSVFVIVMVLIETLLTVWLIRSWKKQSIIEIIRN